MLLQCVCVCWRRRCLGVLWMRSGCNIRCGSVMRVTPNSPDFTRCSLSCKKNWLWLTITYNTHAHKCTNTQAVGSVRQKSIFLMVRCKSVFPPVSSQWVLRKMRATAALCHCSESHTRAWTQTCILTCTVTNTPTHAWSLIHTQHKSWDKTCCVFPHKHVTNKQTHTHTFLTPLLGSCIVRLR